jgi:carbamoyl-phosphate synthase large subunit
MGFKIAATGGTAATLRDHGVLVETVHKVSEGRPHVVDHIKNSELQIVINVSLGRRSSLDAYHIRRGALLYNVLYTTTLSGARALAEAVHALQQESWDVTPLQEYHGRRQDAA